MTKRTSTLTPHDAYFKKALENPEAVKQLLGRYLPKECLALIDLTTAKRYNVSFIDESLQATESDVVFSVKTHEGIDAYIYVLVEHQRNPHQLLPFRMLKYIIQVMDVHQTEHSTTVLPLVIPLVIYNGDRAYPYSMDLFDLFSPETREQAKTSLVAPYPLIDLSQLDTKTIRDDSWAAILINALKYGPSKASPKDIIALLEVPITALAEKMDMAYIKLVFFYLCEAKDKEFQQELQQEFHTTLQPILGDKFMTSIADAYRQEGMEKGIEKGMEKGMHLARLETAHEMLIKGMNEAMIVEITKLNLDEIRNEAKKLKRHHNTKH